MSAKMRQSPYHDHIYHWDVTEGEVGTKARRGGKKNQIVWGLSDGETYLVCPHCRKIMHVPEKFIYGSEITCLVCPICHVDYSYTLKGRRVSLP